MLTEFAFWMMRDRFGRRRKSPCKYTEAEAKERDPDAEKIDGTSEWRNLHPPGEALYKASISYRGEWDDKPMPTVAHKDEAG